ncbi:MAG: ester cyclase [Candidatus Melainabacteria bacterium]|uniref:ester cyclase n=1 Tax=Thiobacillus sp. 63-78 TaxID=1895859 RepID=UPI000A8087E1|nr:ester cyclase [Thiobacillus sp. 63-78]MBN8763541.1 ester cyclase [Thiobacillus sp.]MBN8772801.1 ester cyclase [Thiobacillus sp.]MBN9397503.1 ester cyclase [Candidatus Melainabacteria bacterium]
MRIVSLTMLATVLATVSIASAAATPTKGEKAQVQANLKKFDQLDFDAYSQRKDMKLFKELHCSDVKVVFPDGRVTNGIEQHLSDMDNILFNGTPDSRITSHPISFGSGEWTVATGVLEATFSEPMKLPDGKSIPPTGKKVKMSMVTLAKWKNGCIAEEHLFWDNAEYMKQLGLTK